MEKKCCDCYHLDRNDTYKEWFSDKIQYKCKEKYCYKKLDDSACGSFKELRTTGSYTPSGCYITTIVCDVLGYPDNCELLCVLRNFRDKILKKDPKYVPLLLEYDSIGPKICECITSERMNDRLCLGLLKYFLVPCVVLIKKQKYDEAIEVYKNLVMHLNDNYDLGPINVNNTQEYDIDVIGKGRTRINKKASEF